MQRVRRRHQRLHRRRARLDPTKLPAEYAALGKLPEHVEGDRRDRRGVADRRHLRQGRRQRGALRAGAAGVRRSASATKKGRRAWVGLPLEERPRGADHGARASASRTRPASPFAKRGLALPDPGSVHVHAESRPPARAPPARDATTRSARSSDARCAAHRRTRPTGSWSRARESRTGHPIGVLGPQVGYYVPQILMEEDLHGPGIDARGAAFPGVNLFVQLGHGRDYAWSATTATSDNVDTFAEVLCQDDFHYLCKGQCRAMEKLERTNSWTPNACDQTPPGSRDADRLPHGARHRLRARHGQGQEGRLRRARARPTSTRPTARSASSSSTTPTSCTTRSPSARRSAASTSRFNWAYVDADHIAYQLSRLVPAAREAARRRTSRCSAPARTTGRASTPTCTRRRRCRSTSRPHAVDQHYLVSWNNKQAPGWAAADDKFAYGLDLPLADDRATACRRAIKGCARGDDRAARAGDGGARDAGHPRRGRSCRCSREGARATRRDPTLRDAISAAVGVGGRAARTGATSTRTARTRTTQAITLMDAWWPRLVQAEFEPALGHGRVRRADDGARARRRSCRATSPPRRTSTTAGGASSHKDLRDLFDKRGLRGRWSRGYCGGGSKAKCRRALQALAARGAPTVVRAALYGQRRLHRTTPTPQCFDRNRSTSPRRSPCRRCRSRTGRRSSRRSR